MTFTFPPALEMGMAVFLLALVRMTGIFLTAPFYSQSGVPPALKIALAAYLAALVMPAALEQGPRALAILSSPVPMAVGALGELALGFIIGISGAVVLSAVQTAGALVSQDIGLTIANVIDPITNTQTSVIGQI